MTLKRVLWWAVWLFVLFLVVSQPAEAAEMLRCVSAELKNVANQVGAFLGNVVRG